MMNLGMNFMTSPSIHSQCPSPMQVQRALLSPILERCNQLSGLLQELNFKELQAVFTLVLEHVFGFGGHSGWGLRSISRSYQQREFDTIRRFLAPEGPLLRAAYKLLSDTHARFEFPVSCLPVSTQRMFEEGTVSPLYINKVPYHGPSRSITHVLLNAFEYFFFHFAYLILNPNQQKTIYQLTNGVDVLYYCLVEDYLCYFLPGDGRNVPSIPFLAHTSSSAIALFASSYTSPPNPNLSNASYLSMMYSNPIPPTHTSATSRHPHASPSQTLLKKTPSLLKTIPNVSLSPISTSTPSTAVMSDHARMETWRTEILVMVLVEFWLNLGANESRKTSFPMSSPGFTMSRFPYEVLGFDRQLSLVSAMLSDTFAPSHEHIKVVRLFIKHLHFFTNSSKPAIKPSWNLPAQQTALDEFKTVVLHHFVQKKLYYFLRLSFERWPLDATFRLPLETWLSYIQPWRYVSGASRSLTNERDEAEREFDPTWQRFVTENLLFYTVIFQHLLPRFFRMDLTSLKNSYMLFRVTKVFAQEHLNTMIEEAERMLQGPTPSWLSTSASHLGNLTPPCPSHTPTVAGTLRQHIAELEGPGFVYTPLFSNTVVRAKVFDLLRVISDARNVVENLVKENKSKKRGWFRETLASIFSGDTPDDYTSADCNKVILHLQYSAKQLCYLLAIQEEPNRTEDMSSYSRLSGPKHLEPDYTTDRHGLHLTPLGRHQLMNGICKANVEYRGNPDLQPIRNFEVAFLVRLLYHLSSHLNNKYGVEIAMVYSRPDWLGRLSRQVLSPPMTCSKLIKNGTMRMFRREEETLPPRISLRILANRQVLGYILGLYLMMYIFGHGLFTYLLLLAGMFFLYVVAKSALSTTDHHTTR